jgi:hypothetical protein
MRELSTLKEPISCVKAHLKQIHPYGDQVI